MAANATDQDTGVKAQQWATDQLEPEGSPAAHEADTPDGSPLAPDVEERLRARQRGRRQSKDLGRNWRQKQAVQAIKGASLSTSIVGDRAFTTMTNRAGAVELGPITPGSPADSNVFLNEGDVVSTSTAAPVVADTCLGCTDSECQ